MHVIIAEGSVDEILQIPGLAEMLKAKGEEPAPVVASSEGSATEIRTADEGWREFIAGYAQSAQRADLMVRFIEELNSHPEFEVRLGRGKSPWLRVHHRESGLGGSVYLNTSSGRINFRLPPERADACRFAEPRNARPPYQVSLHLTKPDVLDEALSLATQALKASLDG